MRIIYIIIFFILSQQVFSQERLTLEQCEELFIKNNLFLLAEKYNIEASKAAVIQAKIWDLPELSMEINAYNPEDKKYFDFVRNKGEISVAVEQLIYLGGKKSKEVEFAKSNVELAELQYEQLLLNLKFELHSEFYKLNFNLEKLNNIQEQLANIDSLIISFSKQVELGNIPLKDLVRLQTLSISYRKELNDLQSDIHSDRNNLKLLTNIESEIIPLVNDEELNKDFRYLPIFAIEEIKKLALERNPEYLSNMKLIENSTLLLSWQKSLSVPNLSLGLSYEKEGGAFENQLNLTFGISLPFWNKNKGNELAAQSNIDFYQTLKEQKAHELNSEIELVYNNLQNQKEHYNQIANNMVNLELVYNGILENFSKRNISLLEFTDFMESYKESITSFSELKLRYLINIETLNYLTNQRIIN